MANLALAFGCLKGQLSGRRGLRNEIRQKHRLYSVRDWDIMAKLRQKQEGKPMKNPALWTSTDGLSQADVIDAMKAMLVKPAVDPTGELMKTYRKLKNAKKRVRKLIRDGESQS